MTHSHGTTSPLQTVKASQLLTSRGFYESITPSSFRILEASGDRVIVEACVIHAGRTLNHTIYPEEELQAAHNTFTQPYRKPILRHHIMWQDAIGKTIESSFVGTCLHNKPAIQCIGEISDPSAVEKVLSGIYEQISVGSHAQHVFCSICGQDLVKEGFCDHWPGEEYEGQVAGWILRGITFDEWSYVNRPADVNAGNNRIGDRGAVSVSKNSFAGDFVSPKSHAAGNEPAPDKEASNTFRHSTENKGGHPSRMDPEKLQEQYDELKKKCDELEADLAREKKRADDAEKNLKEQKEANERLQGEIQAKDKTIDELESTNEQLNKELKQQFAERFVDYRIMSGRVGLEERDKAIEGYKERPIDALRYSVDDMKEEWTKGIKTLFESLVQRPGIANFSESNTFFPGDSAGEQKGDSKLDETSAMTYLLSGMRRPRQR